MKRPRLRFKRKAELEVSFNWMFTLIIGGIIIASFIGIAMKQKAAADQKLGSEVLNSLRLVISGAKASTDSALFIDTPKVEFKFTCEPDTCTSYACQSQIFASDVPMQNPVSPIFSPASIKGSSMTTWTVDWNVPFRTANFVYITNPNVRYVIVYDASDSKIADFAQNIYDEIPDRYVVPDTKEEKLLITKEIVPIGGVDKLPIAGHTKTVFIVVQKENTYEKFEDYFIKTEFSGVRINPDFDKKKVGSDLLDYVGAIDFYHYKLGDASLTIDPTGVGVPFYGKAPLFAAIFSSNRDMYVCGMIKSVNKLRIISNISSSRASQLYDTYTKNGQCERKIVYKRGATAFDEIYKSTLAVNPSDAPTAVNAELGSVFGKLSTYSEDLEASNRQLLLGSCSTLY